MVVAAFAMMMPACIIVVTATFGRVEQLAVEIRFGQLFDGGSGLSGADSDALLRKEGQRAPTDAAGNHNVRPQFMQPAREQTRCMWGSGNRSDAENLALRGVGLHKRKVCAAAEMFMESAFSCRNGDRHGQMIHQIRLFFKHDQRHIIMFLRLTF